MRQPAMQFNFMGIEKVRFTNIANFTIIDSNIIISILPNSNFYIGPEKLHYSIEYNTIDGIKGKGITLKQIEEIETKFKCWFLHDSKVMNILHEYGIIE
jgi:hypothetical protein